MEFPAQFSLFCMALCRADTAYTSAFFEDDIPATLYTNSTDEKIIEILEVGAESARTDRFASGVTRGFQGIGKPDTIGILQFGNLAHGKYAGKNTAGNHGWRKTTAFFVGPVNDGDGPARLSPGVVQRANNFEPAQHAQNPVEG